MHEPSLGRLFGSAAYIYDGFFSGLAARAGTLAWAGQRLLGEFERDWSASQ